MSLLLPITPAPHETESLWGYLLRLAEENGETTPRRLLARISPDSSYRFDSSLISELVGRPPQQLNHLSLRSPSGDNQLLGVALGKTSRYSLLRLWHPALCPQCLAQKGFIEAFWELSLAHACPTHEREALSSCPKCGDPLTWDRPSLRNCQKCGSDLSHASTPRVSDRVADLMMILRTKLYGGDVAALRNSSKYPLRALASLSLLETCHLIIALAEQSMGTDSKRSTALGRLYTETAANILSDWPNNFHRFLLATAPKESTSGAVGITVHFFSFYRSLFRNRKSSEAFGFLREEFFRFGSTVWDNGVVDPRASAHTKRNNVSLAEIARELGVHVVTAKKWIANGVVPAQVRGNRYIVARHGVSAAPRQQTKHYNARQAAKLLGVPYTLMPHLKARGVLPSLHSPSCARGYDERDIRLLIDILLKRSAQKQPPTSGGTVEDTLTLKEALQTQKFGSDLGKVDFIQSLIEGDVPCLGNVDGTVAGILVSRRVATTRAQRSRWRWSESSSCSRLDAAGRLGCPPEVIRMLTDDGHLEPAPENGRVLKSTVTRFEAAWVPLRPIAQEIGTTVPRLVRLAEDKKIAVLVVGKVDTPGARSYFLGRDSLQKLLDLYEEALAGHIG